MIEVSVKNNDLLLSAIRGIKAVIFDLDGVLCSTDQYHYLAWKQIADQLGIPFDEASNNQLRGVSRMESLNRILKGKGLNFSIEEKRRLAEDKNEIYKKYLERMTRYDIEDSVRRCLRQLRKDGLLIAVGSSSKNAELILKKVELIDYFDSIIDGNDIKQSKPDPEVFLCAAKRLGVQPSHCAVVEDAYSGIYAAKAAGMIAISFHGDKENRGLEDIVINNLYELCELFRRVRGDCK